MNRQDPTYNAHNEQRYTNNDLAMELWLDRGDVEGIEPDDEEYLLLWNAMPWSLIILVVRMSRHVMVLY